MSVWICIVVHSIERIRAAAAAGAQAQLCVDERHCVPPRLALRFELKKQLQFHFVAAGAKTTGCEVCVHGRRRFFCVVPTLF